jgi:hypothetical protein
MRNNGDENPKQKKPLSRRAHRGRTDCKTLTHIIRSESVSWGSWVHLLQSLAIRQKKAADLFHQPPAPASVRPLAEPTVAVAHYRSTIITYSSDKLLGYE